LKKVYKYRVGVTGGTGLLGSSFINKFKKKYIIINYKGRIENKNLFKKWVMSNKFDFFIHFAAVTRKNKLSNKKIKLVNTTSSINIIKFLNNYNKELKYFLFISSSHVYGYSKNAILESKYRNPKSYYGLSKKKVEDFIINNRKKFVFKIGIARIFNFTGLGQRAGYFVTDIINKLKNNNLVNDINQFRDFIHIDDLIDSLNLLIKKKYDKPINICSGNKINLIKICNIINLIFYKKKILYNKKRGPDLYGNNKLLRSLGKKKFKNIYDILKIYK